MKSLQRKWAWQSSLIFIILFLGKNQAQTFQNLVPNGSFENYLQCPNLSSQIYYASPWTGPRINSSDYFNSCSSSLNVPYYNGVASSYPYFLNAKNGIAYAGVHYYKPTEDNREYAQVSLLDTLKTGYCYYVEFYAANYQLVPYWANNVAANFYSNAYPTTTAVINNSIIDFTSHITNYGNPILKDTVKWEKISGIYQATGTEKYVVVGNFLPNNKTDTIKAYQKTLSAREAYMFIDAVSVYSINPTGMLPWSYRDTSIAKKGDSVFIGNKMGGLNFHPKWFTQDGTFIKTNAGITVSPTVTTKYYVQYTLCGVQRTDTVKVMVPSDNDVALRELQMADDRLQIYPNPADDYLELKIEDYKLQIANFRLQITNCVGEMVKEEEIVFTKGIAKIKTDELSQGIYVLHVRMKEGMVNRKFVISR